MQYRTADTAKSVWQTYWYEKDLLNNIVAVYDHNGSKLVSYNYDAWGNFTTAYHNGGASTKAADNPFTYRGYYYDKDLDLYRLGTRYYDSNIGRFINADDISYLGANGDLNGYNLYSYCSNDPVNFYDPTGRWIETVFDLMSLGASVVEVVINPANPWAWAGLIGDAVDLLPVVTGVGETVKATKMVKYADDVIDASHDTIKGECNSGNICTNIR